MMQGFGVHTFRLANDKGASVFCKFHWTPLAGTHSLVWDEAVRIAGADPDYHRRDLWEAIESGQFPEWELGLQLFTEEQAAQFPFDILEPTKIMPEEMVPVRAVGKMVLDRNPVARIHNNQRDGFHRQQINRGRVSYEPNSLGGGCPFQAGARGFVSVPEASKGNEVRGKPELFADHYSQARLFWISQSAVEQRHIVDAFRFELTRVQTPAVRSRVLALLRNVDDRLASSDGAPLDVEISFETAPSVLWDGVIVADSADVAEALARFKNVLAQHRVYARETR